MRKKVLTLIMALAMLLTLVPTALAAEFKDQDEVEDWAEDAVDRWANAGVISGDNEGNFNPTGDLTRAEAAQVLVNLLKLEGTADLSGFADYATAVKDHWAVPVLEAVVAAGIMNGTDKGLEPESTVTREQMLTMICRGLHLEPAPKDAETDIPDIDDAAEWSRGYIIALNKMGVVNGVDNEGSAAPLTDISRDAAVTVLDRLIGGYASEDGQSVEIEEGKITLIVADNVKVEGTADPELPIVVAGTANTVDMEKVEGAPAVQVTVSEVKIENAPAGTTVSAVEGATDVTVGDQTVEPGEPPVVVEEDKEPEPTTPIVPPAPPANPDAGKALEAANKAWDALATLLENKKVNGLIIAEKDTNGHYTLTLDADAIKADQPAFGEGTLDNLMGDIKKAIDDNFGTATLNIKVADDGNPVPVYANKKFDNTNLKAALVYVADGFFYKLSQLNVDEGGAETVYEYKTLTGTVVYGGGTDSANVSLAIKLKGEDVKKVQALADKLQQYLSMDQMTMTEITKKYGSGNILNNVTGEDKYIVVGVELPPSVLKKLKSIVPTEQQFKEYSITQAFGGLKNVEIGTDILTGDAANINSALKTVNSNANLINKVLSKLTISIDGKSVTSTFNPGSTDSAWKDFVTGVAGMFTGEIGNTQVKDYALTGGTEDGTFYAVPVKVQINLPSMGFTATETVIVILNIPYDTTD